MAPIDERLTTRTQALSDWRQACSRARRELEAAGMDRTAIASEAALMLGPDMPRFDLAAISRLGATKGEWRPPTEELCRAIDALCAARGLGPYDLVVRQRWAVIDGDLQHLRVEDSFRIRVGIAPEPAVALQPRVDLLPAVDASGPAGLTQIARGDGGVGKTQLARAVWDRADAENRHVMVWVVASSRPSIVSAYAEAARRTRLELITIETEPDEAAKQFQSWLSSTPLSWLVVLDGVVDPADLKGLWPPITKSGDVVVTTRRRDLRRAGSETIEVGVFTNGEADSYLRDRLTNREARADSLTNTQGLPADTIDKPSLALATELNHLPLALAQAASLILREGITCIDYLNRFRDQSKRVVELFPELDAADEYAHTVATAWLMAVESADRIEPRGLARPALALASLDPDGIPEGIWTGEAGRNYLAAYRTPDPSDTLEVPLIDVSVTDARQALRNLHLLSIVSHNPNPDAHVQAVAVHALVQRTTREQLTEDQRVNTAWAVADELESLWPEGTHNQVLQRNVDALLDTSVSSLVGDEPAPVVFIALQSLVRSGQTEAAIRFALLWYTATASLLGFDHPATMLARSSLAVARLNAEDPSNVAAELEEVLAHQMRILGPNHSDTQMTRSNLGLARSRAGDKIRAGDEFERLLDDQIQLLGSDHPETLTTRFNLAAARANRSNLPEMSAELGELLRDQLRILGSDHPETFATRRILGVAHLDVGETVAAIAALEELLSDQLRVLGPDHPECLATRGSLCAARASTGDGAGDVDLEDLLLDQLRVLGPEHPQTGITRAIVDPANAAVRLRQLLADQQKQLGHDHPDTVVTRSYLATFS